MNYSKQPLTIKEQIERLKSRGLIFNNESLAEKYLYNISYYRLRAYTHPFQNNENPDHPFIKFVSFEQIIELYVFDRRLRLLVLNAIEKIEIALRTKIVYEYSLEYGSHWYESQELYKDIQKFHDNRRLLNKEIARSSESFIKHYKNKYHKPTNPPAWMSLEVSSLGLLNKMFSNLKNSKVKKQISQEFGLPTPKLLSNWVHSLVEVRNICAHHSRLWNRRFTINVNYPQKTTFKFLENKPSRTNKLYAVLCLINYLNMIVSPKSDFVNELKILIHQRSIASLNEMGFPENWEDEVIWKVS
jgi:abortive infection bacteriophage resistance protein